MRTRIGKHVNEIFSFSIMLLMAIALVAGQADATMYDGAPADTKVSAGHAGSTALLDASVFIDTDPAALTLRIEMVLVEVAESLPIDITTGPPGEVIGIKLRSEQ